MKIAGSEKVVRPATCGESAGKRIFRKGEFESLTARSLMMASCKNCGVTVGFFSKKKVSIDSETVEIYCEDCYSGLIDATTPMWESPDSRLLAMVPDHRGKPAIVVYSGEPDDGQALIRSVDLPRREVLWEYPIRYEDFEECRYGQHDGKVVFVNSEGSLVVVDAKTGAVHWEKPLEANLHSSPRLHVDKGLLVVTDDRRAAYYDLKSGELNETQGVTSQDQAETLLDECVQQMDSAWDTVVCGEIQFELFGELTVNTEIDSGYPRNDLSLLGVSMSELEPIAHVRGMSLKTERRNRTVFDSSGMHQQELLTLSVEGWDLGSYCGIVGDRLVCWGANEWGDETTVGLFVFDPNTLDLKRTVTLGSSASTPDYAYTLGAYLCLCVDMVINEEEQECIFVVDPRTGKTTMRIVDGKVYLGDEEEVSEQL